MLEQIGSIAAACTEADGTPPLDEATWLALRHLETHDVDAAVTDDGFAVVVDDRALSLAVHPTSRGRGYAGALLADVLARHRGDLTGWSHGNHPAAAALARRHGFARVRDLWVLRRSASSLPLPDLRLPEGLRVRGYLRADRESLLRVNAAAFAGHPEQGGMDGADLAARMSEPWWDPADLLVAVDADDRMLGFHWTKVHDAATGEVYVIGVAPEGQGRGLGTALAIEGLNHLAERGVDEVHLYVEADNVSALALYAGLGFTHAAADTHVMYARTTVT